MKVALETLLSSAPYLKDLAERHADWFAAARKLSPDIALAAVLDQVGKAGQSVATEDEIGRELRIAKGRVALLAAVSEVEGRWSTAQSTPARAIDCRMNSGGVVISWRLGGRNER